MYIFLKVYTMQHDIKFSNIHRSVSRKSILFICLFIYLYVKTYIIYYSIMTNHETC